MSALPLRYAIALCRLLSSLRRGLGACGRCRRWCGLQHSHVLGCVSGVSGNKFNDRTFQTLGDSCPQLEAVSISWAGDITAKSVSKFMRCCPNLRILELSSVHRRFRTENMFASKQQPRMSHDSARNRLGNARERIRDDLGMRQTWADKLAPINLDRFGKSGVFLNLLVRLQNIRISLVRSRDFSRLLRHASFSEHCLQRLFHSSFV